MNEFIWDWLNIKKQIKYLSNTNRRGIFMKF